MEAFADYALFLAKSVTVVVAVAVLLAVVLGLLNRQRGPAGREGRLDVQSVNDRYRDMQRGIESMLLSERELKSRAKEDKKREKAHRKGEEEVRRPRVFLLDFKGDLQASAVGRLREEISAVLQVATPEDEVILKLESPGGVVHGYGLAAAQLERMRNANIPLTVCVDEVAASGGYLMACVANRIVAAPFAMIGSIGVIAQLPNFHRLLKKHDIDIEQHTAGEYKRTLTMFGMNTDKAREKFVEELQEIHGLFKSVVARFRPALDLDRVATGEVWHGIQAMELQLVDQIQTSDDYILARLPDADIYHVRYELRKTLPERLGMAAEAALTNALSNWWAKGDARRWR